MSITSIDHHVSLRHEEPDALGTALHLQLDELVESGRDLADQVAERARALGWAPDGRCSAVASASSLPAVPEGELPVHDVVNVIAALLLQASATTRRDAEHAAAYDSVAQDLLNAVIGLLEQHAWMFAAQGRA